MGGQGGGRCCTGRSNTPATGGPRGQGRGLSLLPRRTVSLWACLTCPEKHTRQSRRGTGCRGPAPFPCTLTRTRAAGPQRRRGPCKSGGAVPGQVRPHFLNSSSSHRPALPRGARLAPPRSACLGRTWGSPRQERRACAFQPKGVSPALPLWLDWYRFPENKPVRGDSDSGFVTAPPLRVSESEAGDPLKERCWCHPPPNNPQ